jgi:hypothetical protein
MCDIEIALHNIIFWDMIEEQVMRELQTQQRVMGALKYVA